jgi:hypothetical protein
VAAVGALEADLREVRLNHDGSSPTRDVRLGLCGIAAVVFPLLYVASDAMELVAGGLYPAQLWVTYVAEAGVPFFMMGLDAYQQPRAGLLGLSGALAYGAAFVGFSATVLYPLVTGVTNADRVFAAFGAIYTVHAVLALVGGSLFGLAVVRARVYPRWTGIALIAGLVISVALVASGQPEAVQTLGTAIRCLAFARMGLACLDGTVSGARSRTRV